MFLTLVIVLDLQRGWLDLMAPMAAVWMANLLLFLFRITERGEVGR